MVSGISLWALWLIATAILLVLELLTGFVATFCLAVGCLVAALLAFSGAGLELQLAGVVIGTIMSFVFFAPFIRKLRPKSKGGKKQSYNSNMDALIGRTAVLDNAIPAGGMGRLRIDGDSWQARSVDGTAIPTGAKVEVLGYDSIVLVVEII